MDNYKVTILVEIIESSIEATSIAHAKELMENDINGRVHKGDIVNVISLSAEKE